MSLVGWWKLDGNAEDSSGYGNDGTVNGATAADGKVGGALEFDGSSNDVVISDVEPVSHLSISAWVFPHDSTSRQIIAGESESGSETMDLRVDYNGDLTCLVRDSTGYYRVNYSGWSTNTWYHLVGVFDSDSKEARLYVNGTLENSVTTAESELNSNSYPFIIGSRNYNSDANPDFFDGKIDDVRVYDHVLSQKEVKQLSRAKVLHYKFDNFAEPTENMLPKALREMSSTTGWDQSYHSPYSHQFVSNVDGREHVYELTHDGSSDGDWHSRYYNLPTTSVGEEYVFSLEYKVTQGSDKPNNPTLYQDGWKTGGNADKELLFDKPIGNGWRRIAHKFTITTAGDPVLRMSTGYTSNEWKVFMDNFQYEKKDHATPFVNGTREDEVKDSSGYNNNATLDSNTPAWVEDSIVGSGAYRFDGSSYVNAVSLDLGTSFTISLWTRYSNLHNYGASFGSEYCFSFTSYSDSHMVCGIGDGSSWANSISTDTGFLSEGEWIHLAATYDGSTLSLYKNGEFIGSESNNITVPEAIYHVGHRNNQSYYHEGDIDDVRVYSEPLSQSEIQEIYKQRASIDGGGGFHSHELSEDVEEGVELYVMSSGYATPRGSDSELSVNGNEIGARGRGINILEIDRQGNKINTESFDVYSSPTTETDNLVQFIENAKNGHILMFAEMDHAGNIESNGISKIQSLGSEKIVDVSNDGRSSWAFICKKGSGKTVYGETFAPTGDGPVFLEHTLPDDLNIRSKGSTEAEFNEVGPGADSLVGYWPLDGNTMDYSGNGNDGTNNGASVTSGLGQSAYSFDGSDDYVEIPSSGDIQITSDSVTFTSWFNFDASTSNNHVLSKHASSNYGYKVAGKPGQMKFSLYDGSINDVVASFEKGGWKQVAATWNGDEMRLYINGKLKSTTAYSGTPTTGTQNLLLAADSVGQGHLSGSLADIRIFNRALTAEEVKTLYNLTDPRQGQRVVQASDGAVYTKGEFSELL